MRCSSLAVFVEGLVEQLFYFRNDGMWRFSGRSMLDLLLAVDVYRIDTLFAILLFLYNEDRYVVVKMRMDYFVCF